MLLTRYEVIHKTSSTRSRASPALLSAMNLDPFFELYFGQIDASHQFHCLNIIRNHPYWDSYYAEAYGSWDNAHELGRTSRIVLIS
jgi:IS30 family transposase